MMKKVVLNQISNKKMKNNLRMCFNNKQDNQKVCFNMKVIIKIII